MPKQDFLDFLAESAATHVFMCEAAEELWYVWFSDSYIAVKLILEHYQELRKRYMGRTGKTPPEIPGEKCVSIANEYYNIDEDVSVSIKGLVPDKWQEIKKTKIVVDDRMGPPMRIFAHPKDIIWLAEDVFGPVEDYLQYHYGVLGYKYANGKMYCVGGAEGEFPGECVGVISPIRTWTKDTIAELEWICESYKAKKGE